MIQVSITKPIFSSRDRNPNCYGCNVPNWIYWSGFHSDKRRQNDYQYRMGPGIGPGVFFGFTEIPELGPSTNEAPVKEKMDKCPCLSLWGQNVYVFRD